MLCTVTECKICVVVHFVRTAKVHREVCAIYVGSVFVPTAKVHIEICAIYVGYFVCTAKVHGEVGGVFVRTAKVHIEVCAIYVVGFFVCTAQSKVFCRVGHKYKVNIDTGILYL